ncbi:kinase-like domain-containing protein [Linnemannia elongata]|nr:kinase-like domain-containing protein [Linnemannia elongata]
MHVVTKPSPRTKNASAPSQGEAESDTSAPTINTSSEQDGPVWRDPLEHPSFITTSPTTTMSQEDLYPNSFSMALQSPLPLTDRGSFASQLEASLLATNMTAASATLNSSTSASSSSQGLRSTMTSTAESNSMEDSKGDLHSEETKPTTSVPSNSSEPAEEDKSSRTSTDKPSHHHAHSPSHTHSRDSSAHSPPPIVKETLDACITVSPTGVLQVKQYELRRIIGQGAFGIVNLGVDVNTGIKYAVKEFSKAKLRKKDRQNLFRLGHRGRGPGRRGPAVPAEEEKSPLDLIRGEIAILKKLNHVNIVKLYEVLDVAAEDSMYMVFELCELGALTEVSVGDKPGKIFTDSECRDVFQQMVLGIEYLHEHDIIHRDIKPDNLLRSADGTLKIVDFGVSEMFTKKGDDMIKKSAGSPAFMAPELCRSHGEVSGKPTDLWSMGVTLFCIRYGRLPFKSGMSLELQKMINEDEPDLGDEQDPRFRTTITRLLEKDPSKRITIDELRNDPWLTDDGRRPLISKDENTQNAVLEVTDDDLRGAVQQLHGLFRVLKAVYKFKQLRKSPSPSSRTSSRDRREKAAGEPSNLSLSPPLLDSPPSEPADDIVMPAGEMSDSLLAKIDALNVQRDPEELEDDDDSVSKSSPPFAVAVADQQQERSATPQEFVVQASK